MNEKTHPVGSCGDPDCSVCKETAIDIFVPLGMMPSSGEPGQEDYRSVWPWVIFACVFALVIMYITGIIWK